MKKDTFENYLTYLYIGWMFLVYPLFSKGNYFDITESKWKMLCVITGFFILLWSCSRITEGKWLARNHYQKTLDVFIALVLLSTVMSPYGNVAWLGSGSRYTGALFMLLMIVTAMLVGSSNIRENLHVLLYVFALGGTLIAAWAVLNFLGIDIFGMHKGMLESQYRVFMSGIGNIVFLGSFLAVFVPVMFVQFQKADVRRNQVIYGSALLAGAMGLFAAGNDSGVIAILVVLFVILPVFVDDVEGIVKYLLGMNIVMGAGILMKILSKYTVYGENAFDNVLKILLGLYGFEIGFCVCVLLEIVIFLLRKKFFVKGFKISYYVMLVIGIIAVLCTQEQFRSLLVFGENWGTDRGYVWIKAGEIFAKEPFIRKLFGNGADTFGQLLLKYIGSDIGVNGMRFDNVHCEYLQYLLSYGLVGLGTYLYMAGSIIYGLVQNKDRKCCLAVAAGICGYMIQATVGLNQVFTTPLLFIFCGMGVMLIRPEVVEKTRERKIKKGKRR